MKETINLGVPGTFAEDELDDPNVKIETAMYTVVLLRTTLASFTILLTLPTVLV